MFCLVLIRKVLSIYFASNDEITTCYDVISIFRIFKTQICSSAFNYSLKDMNIGYLLCYIHEDTSRIESLFCPLMEKYGMIEAKYRLL